MATFEYNALTSGGRLMKGTIEAGTRDEADQLLEQMQLSINSIETAKPKKAKTAIGRSEFLLFNQQLAALTKVGIPLERGLRELSKDVASKHMRKLIEGIVSDLEAGIRHPRTETLCIREQPVAKLRRGADHLERLQRGRRHCGRERV